jgi:hypothetical protein
MRKYIDWNKHHATRSAAAAKAANARWDRVRAARKDEPLRASRVVELTIRDTHRTMRVIRLKCEPSLQGWGRFAVMENGAQIGKRRFGHKALAALLAASLR